MYEFYSLYRFEVDGQAAWRAVFRKPCRQRMTKAVFADYKSALVYAMRVEKRFRRLEKMNNLKSLRFWAVGVGAHVFVMLLGLTAWWLLVGR